MRTAVLLRLLPVVWLMTFALSAQAQNDSPPSFWKGLSADAVFGYISYDEPTVMRQFGLMSGINLGYTQMNDLSATRARVEAEFVTGSLTYDGGTQTTRFQARAKDWIFNVRGTIGLVRELGDGSLFTPYIGAGYRLLNDKIEGAGSYLRRISYLYLPLGASFTKSFSNGWSVTLAGDLDIVVAGVVFSKLSDVNPNYPDLTMTNSGHGFYLTTELAKTIGNIAIHVAPYYQKWILKESSVVYGFVEPANTSEFVGLKLGVDL